MVGVVELGGPEGSAFRGEVWQLPLGNGKIVRIERLVTSSSGSEGRMAELVERGYFIFPSGSLFTVFILGTRV